MEINEIIRQAAALSGREREAFIRQACGGDNATRQAVESQLSGIHDATILPQSHPDAANAPEETLVPDAGDDGLSPTKSMPNANLGIGQQIGPYKLLQPLGEGGMGTVFMAEQREPVQRRVALKIIKSGMDSGQVVARFEAERQALAMMDHPNIARVLDAGSTDAGSPYFVMELVKGTPITDYCDRNKLNIRQRLELFVDVCSAVQHAHHKGIIHRDLKPSNILVTMHDDKPVPKVIDFGVAKATSQRLTEKTMFTAYGQVVGTLEYMSPEQAQMTDLDIDTRSDIYSLGVLLYELLTGTTPLKRDSLREAAFLEILKRIREEEPQRPSTRISESREALDSISAMRQVEPKRFSLLMKGDLDWIVLKSLEKDRTRRYETANAFSADVRRFLSDEPIEARPPSAMYRFQKLARKNRLLFGFIGTVAALLLVGIGVSIYLASWAMSEAATAKTATQTAQAETVKTQEALTLADQRRIEAETQQREAETQRNEANRQKNEAEASAKRAKAILEVVVHSFRSVDPYEQEYSIAGNDASMTFGDGEGFVSQPTYGRAQPAASDMKASEVLIRAMDTLESDEALKDDRVAKAELLYALSESFNGIGDYPRSLNSAERCVALRKAALGETHRETLRALSRLGYSYGAVGDAKKELEVLEPLYRQQQETFGADDPETLKTARWLASTYSGAGNHDLAIEILTETLERQRRAIGEDHRDTIKSLNNLANAYRANGDTERSIALHEQILEKLRVVLGEEHPDTLKSMNNLAAAYYAKGDTDRAIALNEQTLEKRKAILGEEHPETLKSMNNLAAAYNAKGDTDRAIALNEQTLEKRKAVLGEDHPETLTSMNNLANGYRAKGDTDRAIPLYEQVLEKQKAVLGENHPDTLRSMNSLAIAYKANGEGEKAVTLSQQAYYAQVNSKGRLDPGLVSSLYTLTNARHALTPSQIADSTADLLATAEAFESETKPDEMREQKISFGHLLAFASEELLNLGEYKQSEQLARHCIALREQTEPDAWFVPFSKCALAGALSGQGKYEEATTIFLTAWPELTRRMNQQSMHAKALKWGVDHFRRSGNPEQLAQFEPMLVRMQRLLGRNKTLDKVRAAKKANDPNPLQPEIDKEHELRAVPENDPDIVLVRIDACYFACDQALTFGSDKTSDNYLQPLGRCINDLKWLQQKAPEGHADNFNNDAEAELHFLFASLLPADGDEWTLPSSLDRIRKLMPLCSEYGRSQLCVTCNDAAWYAAVSSDATKLNGPLAVELASIACEFCTPENKAGYLDTLAAAHARTGDFDEATATMKEAIAADTDGKYKDVFEQRLKLYESSQPYTEPGK